jgi:hypothetical protein
MNLQSKIKKLIGEGVDPKQAVAIAYNMQLQKAQYGGTTMNLPFSTMEQDPQYMWDANRPDQTAYNNFQSQPQPGVQLDLNNNESTATNMDIYQNGEQLQRMQQNKAYNTATNNYDENGNAIDPNGYANKDYYSKLNIYNPYGGMGLDQSLFYAGQGFGAKDPLKATVGTGLSLFKGARGFLSGYSSAKASKEAAENSYEQQFRPNTNPIYMQEGGQFFGQETMFPIRKIEPSTDEQGVVGYTYYQGKLPTDAGYDPSLHKLFFTKEEHISKQKPGSEQLYESNLINYLNKTNGKVNIRVKQEGGSIDKAEAMTGAFLTETNEAPTVELEKDEFTLNSQTGEIQKVVGEKHTNGGVKADLPAGSQVLSNYTKVGAKTAKELKDMFDISIKPKDTFAKVMDKIDAKIGYKETIEEETEYLKTLEKQQSLDTNDVTKKLNEQHLAKELKENEDKKAELENKRIESFQTLFQEQESRPKKGNGMEVLKKEGGNVYDPNILNLAKQYNLSPDRVMELMQEGGQIQAQQPDQMQQVTQMIMDSLQQGVSPEEVAQQLVQMGIPSEQVMQLIQAVAQQMQGQSPQEEQMEGQMSNPQEESQEPVMAQEGLRIGSKYEDPNLYKKQSQVGEDWQSFGELLKEKPKEVLSEVKRLHPELYNTYFKDDKVPSNVKIGEFQDAINQKYTDILTSAKQIYGENSDKVKAIETQMEQDKFLPFKQDAEMNKNTEIRGRDTFLGNYTSTRPNFELPVLPTEDFKKVKEAGVNTVSELKNKFPDLYKNYVADKNLKGDFWLGEVKTGEVAPANIENAPTEVNPPVRGKDLGAKTVMANLPQDLLLPPSSLANLYKGEVRFGELDPTKMSAEAQNVEAERQRQTASKELYFLNPQQRAALMASGLGQTQMSTNQAIGQAEMFNAQQKQQVDQFNLQNNMKEDLTNIELNKDFERRNLAGQGIYEANMRGFYNNLNAINRQNFADVRDLNLANAAFDKYQTDGSNIMFMPSDTVLNSQGTMKQITQEQYNKMTDAQKQAYKAMTTIKNG